jgi:sirohydrochlorin ferrochelatase
MPEEEKGTKFYLAFLDSNPRPDEMAIRAINDGASKIIILPVFITESTHTVAGQEMVESIHPESLGIQICYTGVLWDSQPLQTSFVQRANEMTGEMDKSKVGILLVGHGQPTEWENIYPEQNKQENLYRDAIREKLITDGYLPDQVVLGWMEFQQPTITTSIEQLAGGGVEKILVFATSLSADSIHSDVEVPAAVAKASLPKEIQVEYVGQYGDHPLAIQAMKEKIAKCR